MLKIVSLGFLFFCRGFIYLHVSGNVVLPY
jgi:hypothetical protein